MTVAVAPRFATRIRSYTRVRGSAKRGATRGGAGGTPSSTGNCGRVAADPHVTGRGRAASRDTGTRR